MADQLAWLSLALALASFARAIVFLLHRFFAPILDRLLNGEFRAWRRARRQLKRRQRIREAEGRSRLSWAAIRAAWMRLEERGREYPVALSLIMGFFFLGLALLLAH